jgi:hypothetical protein
LATAKEFNRQKNKRAALQCLKKKKLYEVGGGLYELECS